MKTAYFITGTDTGAGKTWATVALMRHWQAQGKTVVAMKPVASGCLRIDGKLQNEDALLLQRYASKAMPYELINPYALETPVAPHIAALQAGVSIDFALIKRNFEQLHRHADIVLIEGIGGWAVPLNGAQDVAALAGYLGAPVIMVVGMRLGCINHARLTYHAIANSGADCAGWLAVCRDLNMLALEETIAALQHLLDLPLLGILPYCKQVDGQQKIDFLI